MLMQAGQALNARRGARNSYLHFYHLMRSPTEFSCAISHILEQEVETTYEIIIPDETSSYINRPPKELVLSQSSRTLINNEHSCIFFLLFWHGVVNINNSQFILLLKKHLKQRRKSHIPAVTYAFLYVGGGIGNDRESTAAFKSFVISICTTSIF